jgi:hypothetical protein
MSGTFSGGGGTFGDSIFGGGGNFGGGGGGGFGGGGGSFTGWSGNVISVIFFATTGFALTSMPTYKMRAARETLTTIAVIAETGLRFPVSRTPNVEKRVSFGLGSWLCKGLGIPWSILIDYVIWSLEISSSEFYPKDNRILHIPSMYH